MVRAGRFGELAEVDCGAPALLVSLRVACSRSLNALSDVAVYSLTLSSPWNAKQSAALHCQASIGADWI